MLKQLLCTSSKLIQQANKYQSLIAQTTNNQLIATRSISTTATLFKKSKSKSKPLEEDSDDEVQESLDDLAVDKNSKILDLKVTNLRLDGILKAGLGMARNKIEVNFYESKIRLNGEKVLKKSVSVDEGDEIDVIKGPSPTNPNLLTIARVEVINVTPKSEYIALRLRRCKNLLIENYNDVWKPT